MKLARYLEWKQKRLLWRTSMKVVEYYETNDGHVFKYAECAEAYEDIDANIKMFTLALDSGLDDKEDIIIAVAPNVKENAVDAIKSLFPSCMWDSISIKNNSYIVDDFQDIKLLLIGKDSSDKYIQAANAWKDANGANDCSTMSLGSKSYRSRLFSFFCNYIA